MAWGLGFPALCHHGRALLQTAKWNPESTAKEKWTMWLFVHSKTIHWVPVTAAAKSLQSYPTLCDPIDGSPSGSPVPGILQARTLEWVAISFSNAWKWKVKVKLLSHVRLFATPWTAAYQAPPPMGFSRQEDWNGVPLPTMCQIPCSTCMVNSYIGVQIWTKLCYFPQIKQFFNGKCFMAAFQLDLNCSLNILFLIFWDVSLHMSCLLK